MEFLNNLPANLVVAAFSLIACGIGFRFLSRHFFEVSKADLEEGRALRNELKEMLERSKAVIEEHEDTIDELKQELTVLRFSFLAALTSLQNLTMNRKIVKVEDVLDVVEKAQRTLGRDI
jgi:hypothetical protein